MLYLATQIWLHLFMAFALGAGVLWWWLRQRPGAGVTPSVGQGATQAEALPETLRAARSDMEAVIAGLRSKNFEAESDLSRLRSHLRQANEKAIVKADELTRRKAGWAEEAALYEAQIESLRRELRQSTPAPTSRRPEPRLPQDLFIQAPAVEPTKDDLQKIKGIGRVLEGLLHEIGVFTFREIATWAPADIERIQAKLPQFPGRIRRDGWVDQAAELDGGPRAQGESHGGGGHDSGTRVVPKT